MAAQGDMPADNQVFLYEHGGFGGEKYVITGASSNMNLHSSGWGDRVSSLKMGAKIRAKFCRDISCDNPDYAGSFEIAGKYESSGLWLNGAGLNDWISAFQTWDYDPVADPKATLFVGKDF